LGKQEQEQRKRDRKKGKRTEEYFFEIENDQAYSTTKLFTLVRL
jgi:hypothetical protein